MAKREDQDFCDSAVAAMLFVRERGDGVGEAAVVCVAGADGVAGEGATGEPLVGEVSVVSTYVP